MGGVTRILLIEDSRTQADRLASELRENGLEVMVAYDAPEGLQAAEEYRPDAILLDINLPSMNGYQVCKRLKRDQSTVDIPIIMLTSSDSSDDILRGLDAGATDYIAKDAFATENLIVTLQSIGLLDFDMDDED